MPENLSVEEKAIYIYCKLCKTLVYDQGYLYNDKLNEIYKPDFSKQRVESVKPGSKVVCWDFSRIYAKFINDLNDKIAAVTVQVGGHWLTGFYTDKISIGLEGIDYNEMDKTNDLTKLKNGVIPNGLDIMDKDNILPDILRRMTELVTGEKPIETIDEYVAKLRKKPRKKVQENFEKKFESFMEILQKKDIKGNEAVLTLISFTNCGFFTEDFVETYVGKKIIEDDKETYTRLVLMQKKNTKNNVYVFDPNILTLNKERI